MTMQYTPVFLKDLDKVILPSLSFDTEEEALAVETPVGYGLTATAWTTTLQDGRFCSPYIVATLGDRTVWIIGGTTLDELTQKRHAEVQNQEQDSGLGSFATIGLGSTLDYPVTTTDLDTPVTTTDVAFGGGGGFDGAGAGGSF